MACIVGCKTGLSFTAQAGGLASGNVARDCHISRSSEFGVRAVHWAYRAWSPGAQSQSAPTPYRFYDHAIYSTAHRVREFGQRPPVHRSGTMSDGLVEWTFMKSFTDGEMALHNECLHCSITLSGRADIDIGKPGALTRI